MGFSKLQVAAEPKESTLPAKPSPSVPLCPHQTLFFDRLQRILALPNLMEERFRHKTVNALTATSSPPSHYLHHAETQICGPPPAPQAASRISKGKLFCQDGDFSRLHLHSPTRPITRETTTPKTPSAAFSTTPASGSARGRKLSDSFVIRAVYGRLVPASVEVPEGGAGEGLHDQDDAVVGEGGGSPSRSNLTNKNQPPPNPIPLTQETRTHFLKAYPHPSPSLSPPQAQKVLDSALRVATPVQPQEKDTAPLRENLQPLIVKAHAGLARLRLEGAGDGKIPSGL